MHLSRLVRKAALAAVLLTAPAVFALASPASANLVGPPNGGGFTCTSVSFYYTLFPAGSTTSGTETVTIGGTQVASQPFTFSGTIFTDIVPVTVPGGTHTVVASSTFTNSVEGPGSGSFNASVTCGGGGPPPATTFFCNQPNTATTCTPGYWKNHVTLAVLPQALGGYSVATVAEAKAVLSSTACNTPVDCMADQLLATLLNVANGLPSGCITGDITSAQALLTTLSYGGPGVYTMPTTAQKGQALTLAGDFNTYNSDHANPC
jgi:hypothetical protein